MGSQSVSEKQAKHNTWGHMLGMHTWQEADPKCQKAVLETPRKEWCAQ